MTHKVVLITGGTSGVGKAIAKSFALKNDAVVIVGRNEQRAKVAVTEIQQFSKNPNVSYLLGDLANPEQNFKVTSAFKKQYDKLDVLVNSAGNIPQTADENINLNLRSHYQFTHALKQPLSHAENPSVFVITGMPSAIKFGPIFERQTNLVARGLWLLTHKTLLVSLLAAELEPVGIKVNALFPGGVKSDLLPWTKKLTNETVSIAEKLASSPELRKTTGKFFDDSGKPVKLNDCKYNSARAKKVLSPYLEDIS